MKKILIILCTVVFAFCLGFVFSNVKTEINIEEAEETTANLRTKATCVIEKEYVFEFCSHKAFLKEQIDKKYVGKTKNELSEIFGEYEIISFSPELVKLKKTEYAYCDKHLILKIEKGRLCLYSMKVGDGEKLKSVYDIDYSNLSAEEQLALRKGKVFSSYEEIENYILGKNEIIE